MIVRADVVDEDELMMAYPKCKQNLEGQSKKFDGSERSESRSYGKKVAIFIIKRRVTDREYLRVTVYL